jgi:succinyl-CoA synthetase beta subunit/citryl-CoA synthetase large subunit
MRLLEHQSKKLLSTFGLKFSPAHVVTSPGDAERVTSELAAPVLVKAQVPFGGRGKAGAIVEANTPQQAKDAAARILGLELRGNPVRTASIEPKLSVAREFFVGISWDTAAKLPVAILGNSGGVDVESASPDSVARSTFDPFTGFRAYQARELARRLGFTGTTLTGMAAVLEKLANAFLELDGITIEINPLAETIEGELIGLDAHVGLDDDASYRLGKQLSAIGPIEHGSTGRAPTPLEKEAQRIDSMDHRGVAGRVVEFDGELALLIGGGGASLTIFDAIRRYNGRPANYCEVGGNPTEAKVAALTSLLLNKPGVKKLAVIMNVVNNTRADVMARGVIEGVRRTGRTPREVVSVFRIPGSWEDEARAILAEERIEALGREVSLDAAAKLAVERTGAHAH